jgi:hypothetical protein
MEAKQKAKQKHYGPPPKEVEIIPDLRDLVPDLAKRNRLARLVDQYWEWGIQKKEAEAAQKPLNSSIKEMLGEYGIGKCWHGELKINYYNSSRTTIDRGKLMEELIEHVGADLAASIIDAASVTKDCPTLKISAREEEEE